MVPNNTAVTVRTVVVADPVYSTTGVKAALRLEPFGIVNVWLSVYVPLEPVTVMLVALAMVHAWLRTYVPVEPVDPDD